MADLFSASKGEARCFYSKASIEDNWLWHKRLSHLNFKTMNSMWLRINWYEVFLTWNSARKAFVRHVKREKSNKASHRSKEIQQVSLSHCNSCIWIYLAQ